MRSSGIIPECGIELRVTEEIPHMISDYINREPLVVSASFVMVIIIEEVLYEYIRR